MGADAHVFHAEPAPIAHSLMPSPLLLTQTGDNPIGVRGTGGAPTLVAEFPREKKLGHSPDWARDVTIRHEAGRSDIILQKFEIGIQRTVAGTS